MVTYSWVPVKKFGESRLQNGQDEYDISTDNQNDFFDTTEVSLTKLNFVDTVKNQSVPITKITKLVVNIQNQNILSSIEINLLTL